MPATIEKGLKRVHEDLKTKVHDDVEDLKKRAKMPFVPISTRVFRFILHKSDKGDTEVKDIGLPRPKAILDFESVEYVIPGLKVPKNEEDDNLDLEIEFMKYQEGEEHSTEHEGSAVAKVGNKVC